MKPVLRQSAAVLAAGQEAVEAGVVMVEAVEAIGEAVAVAVVTVAGAEVEAVVVVAAFEADSEIGNVYSR
jgi:hypothetical protein